MNMQKNPSLIRACSVVGLLVLMTLAASASTLGFKPAVNYPVSTTPRAVAAGDFNGDGKMDLAVANYGDPSANDDGSVNILLGNGDGTYQTATNFAAGKNPCPAYPCAMAVGDFNADGKADIAVPNSGNAVSILLGNGDGTFQASMDIAAGNGSVSVIVGDQNGDKRPDLVVANFGDHTVSVLLGNGDGTFQTHVDYPTGNSPTTVAVADVNSDGMLDLAVTIGVAGIETFLGKGDGTLQSGVECSCGAFPGLSNVAIVGTIAISDFNGDGKPDLALTYFHTIFLRGSFAEVDVLIGNGDGTFGPPTSTGFQMGGINIPPSGAAADFDGDGRLDLAVVSDGLVNVLPGNRDGTFQPPVSFAVGSYTSAIALADFDGNKSADVVVTNSADNTISVLLNTVGTDFSISASAVSPSTVNPGQSATSTVSLSLLNAFDNPVSLACSVQPAQAGSPTCSLTPNSVTFDASGKATAQLTITAGAAVASLTQPSTHRDSQPWHPVWLPIAGLAFAGAGLGRNNSSRRKLLGLFVGCFLLAGLIFQSACGGSSSGPKSKAYTVTVTGTSGSTQRSTTVTLTVQ